MQIKINKFLHNNKIKIIQFNSQTNKFHKIKQINKNLKNLIKIVIFF